jgi:hypothetical protein
VLTATASSSTVASLSWTASYGAIGYQVDNGITTADAGNALSYSWTGLTSGQSYTFKVRSYDGSGNYSPWSSSSTITMPTYNLASGGTLTPVSNYNGTGQTWNVHTFTSSGTLTVTSAPTTFSTAVVGGGGGGGMHINDGQNRGPGGGYGGSRTINATTTLSVGAITVTVGGSGASNRSGTSSALGAITASGGGAGGNCRDAPQTPNGGGGTTSTVNGSSVNYGQNGTAGGNQYYGSQAAVPGGGGRGGACGFGGDEENGGAGRDGVVIVAYRIA